MSPALQAQVTALRQKLERQGRDRCPRPVASTGVLALDRLLPGGGLRCGSLVEYLADTPGSGAGLLAMAAARTACQQKRMFVVVDRQGAFYPPAAAACGIDLAQTIVLQPQQPADELWALDQVLRCTGVGAVWMACGLLDGRAFRRLQLAAECGGTLGLLIRPAKVRRQPSWSEVQWLIAPQPSPGSWRLSVELARCRGGGAGRSVQLDLNEQTGLWEEVSDHATHLVHPSSQLADSKGSGRHGDSPEARFRVRGSGFRVG